MQLKFTRIEENCSFPLSRMNVLRLSVIWIFLWWKLKPPLITCVEINKR